MARFRNIAESQPVQNWWDNGNNQIAFSRGNKAFLAINNDDYGLDQWLQTGLPRGEYCDVIGGYRDGDRCTGKTIKVQDDGRAQITISNTEENPMIAIHASSKL